MKKMNIAGIATAMMIGFTAISGAEAAPFATAAQAGTALSDAGLVQVADRGDRGDRGGGRQRGERNRGRHNNGHHNNKHHGNKHHGKHHHGRGHGFHGYVDYGRNCFWKHVKVFDPFIGGFVYEKRFVCSRYY